MSFAAMSSTVGLPDLSTSSDASLASSRWPA
jgi:hypothetical protein